MIVPFAAGGPTDVSARIVAERMSRTLGQQIIIENVLGAGGTTGSIRAMRANPDGYTIEMGQLGTHAASVAFYPNLAYRPEADFAYIGLAVDQAVLIVARRDFPPNNLKEFVTYVKANSDKLNMAHAGVGSITHFTCLLLNSVIGANPAMIPFNGSAPAINALVAGQVDYMCDPVSDIVQQVEAGTMKVYATGTAVRNPALPNIPTARSRLARVRGVGLVRRCSHRKERRSPSSTRLPPPSTRRSTTRPCASACPISAARFPANRDAGKRRSRAS
jgi:tripartite-type tricarboxylate transporter receptor subunit TctC